MPLLDIAEKTDIPMKQLHEVAVKLVEHGLLRVEDTSGKMPSEIPWGDPGAVVIPGDVVIPGGARGRGR